MRLSSLFLGSCLILAQAVVAENVLEQVCGGIQKIVSCKMSFDFPTGAKVKTCPNKFFEVDACKTRYNYRYPCPTWRKPGRMCDGWTCVAGTNTKWIDVPCGIKIITKKVDFCKAARTAMLPVGGQFLDQAGAICNCLPKALETLSKGLFQSIANGADLSSAATKMISEVMGLQKCVLDNGFSVKDNKVEVETKDLSTSGGWVVFRAAEIDLATYGELAAAISPCFISTCAPKLIGDFFRNYLIKSKALMGDQIVVVLNGWIDIFGRAKDKVAEVSNAAEILTAHLKNVPQKVEEVQKKVCKQGECIGPAISTFLKKVSQIAATFKTFQDLQRATDRALDTVPKLVDLTQGAIDAAEVIPDASYFIQLILDGKLTKIEHILESIKITKELPKVAAELQAAISPIVELIAGWGHRGTDVLVLLDEMISLDWSAYPLEFENDAAGEVRNGMLEIQNIIQTELQEPLRNLTSTMEGLDQVLGTFPIKDGRFKLEKGVASYRRWSTVSMDLPCTRSRRQKFEVAGFRGSFDYPEFYACKYSDKLSWPNHHIPYVKFLIG